MRDLPRGTRYVGVRYIDRDLPARVGGTQSTGAKLRRLKVIGLLSFHAYAHWATYPPSTVRAWPVTKEAALEHSHSTTSATSSGVPMRPVGLTAVMRSKYPG